MTETTDLLNIRPLRRRLKKGKEGLGMWLGITDPLAVEAIAADCDLDWILLDMEHGGAGWEDLKMVMLGWKWSDVPIFVRPPSHDQKFLMAALDLGVSGFVVPFVNSPEDARRVAEACRYPPMGIRGSAPRRVSRHYTMTDKYKASADDDVFVMVQIEHKNAVECVEEIAEVPGIDALFIGPGDLSYSYGLPFQFDHPTIRGRHPEGRGHGQGHWPPGRHGGRQHAGRGSGAHRAGHPACDGGPRLDVHAERHQGADGGGAGFGVGALLPLMTGGLGTIAPAV